MSNDWILEESSLVDGLFLAFLLDQEWLKERFTVVTFFPSSFVLSRLHAPK